MRHQLRGPLPRVVLATLAGAVAFATPVDGRAANDDLRLPPTTFPTTVDHWRAGRITDALDTLPSDDSDGATGLETLVLRATLLGQAGRGPDAERLWRTVIDRAVWMRTFARRALVTSLAGRGAPADAEPVLAELVRSDATRHLDLILQVADAYRVAGDPDRAVRHYRDVLGRQRRGLTADAARLGLAAALESSGDADGALAMLRETKLRHWRGDAFETAQIAERRLARVRGVEIAPFSEPEYRMLVQRLRLASRHASALALIEEWRAASPASRLRDRIEAERIATLYAQRDNAAAVEASARFYETFESSPLVPGIHLTDFRLAVRMGDIERARGTGLDLWAGRVPGATGGQRRDAATLLAPYLVAVGEVADGLDLYRELFRTATTPDDKRAFLWRAGVAALRDGQVERALTNLRGLMSRDPSGDLAPAGLYWLGVAEAESGDTEAAVRSFRVVSERFPYHYYGLQARARLTEQTGRPEPVSADGPIAFPKLALDDATRRRAEFRAAMVLARAGLSDDAAWYLRRLLGRRPRDRGLALLAARASAEADDHASVARVLVNHFGAFIERPATGLPSDFWTLVYPRPFWDTVQASAARHGVDPTLLVALMRQESRFDPEARSAVGAIGLLQVMTYTAAALAQSAGVGHILGDQGVDDATLAEPVVNTAIAARLTANLLEMFDGAMPPVVASYNAGEERVAIWWTSARALRADVFVDTIPYSETRRFVREVLTNYDAYQRIYAGK